MNDKPAATVAKLELELGPGAPFIGAKLYLLAAAVFLIGVLFESFSSSRFIVTDLLSSLKPRGLGDGLDQASTFLSWRAATLLLLGCAVGAGALSVATVLEALKREKTASLLLISNAVLLASITALVFASLEESASFLDALTKLLVARDPALGERQLDLLLMLPKRSAEVIAGCVGVAMAAVMILPERITLEDLRKRIRRLRLLLYASAAMLVLGVISVRCSYGFALSFTATEEGPAAIKDLIDGGVGMAAAFYTLALAGGYIPAAVLTGSFARRFAAAAQEAGLAGSEADFLKANQLEFSWRGQMGRILAVAAPLISAAVPGITSLVSA